MRAVAEAEEERKPRGGRPPRPLSARSDMRLRRLLLVRACEEADPEGAFVTHANRQAATEAALTASEPPAAQLQLRADLLLERIGRDHAGVAAFADGASFAPPSGLVLVAAFVLGLAADALGRERALNLLAFPLFGLLVWNAAVYLAALAGALSGRRGRRDHLRGLARIWTSLRLRVVRAAGAGATGFAGAALARFAELWLDAAAAFELARWRARLHAGAALFALALVAGMYVAGFAFAYSATWESTFLAPEQVRPLLAAVLGPASGLLGDPVPDAAAIAALQAPGSGPAAPWIHRWAITAALFVVIPRALLAAREATRAKSLRRRLAPELEAPYYLRLLAAQRGDGAAVRLLPYSTEPSPRTAARLRELAHDLVGNRARVQIEAHVAYGGRPPSADEGDALFVIFDLAQSPEREVHGRFLEELAATRSGPAGGPLLVLLDAERYAALAEPERLSERRRAWARVVAEVGLEPMLLAPDRSADALLDEARGRIPVDRERGPA